MNYAFGSKSRYVEDEVLQMNCQIYVQLNVYKVEKYT